MSGLAAGELEFLFTANTAGVEQGETRVRQIAQRVESRPARLRVEAENAGALAGMDQVETAARQIVSQDIVARVEADISQAETEAQKIRDDLDYLRSIESTVEVSADITRAEDRLQRVERSLTGLNSARATMEVAADTSGAEGALEDLEGTAGEAGSDAGEAAGGNLAGNIIDAIGTIPVAGAIVGVGAAIGVALFKGIEDGLDVEVKRDRLQALTGITPEQAATIGRASGEAYANVFGESIESNMDSARIAIQSGLLDPAATARDSQTMIESLAGISDILGEDVLPISQAVTTMLRTGIVKSADEAFDVIAAGAREGVNLHEDLLDTMIEYPVAFGRLGLSAEEAMGLMNQGLEGGARNADLAADALKEFQIRATDASEGSAAGFELLGLNAEEMTAKITAGGQGAREGLEQVLTKLGEMEPSADRTAAAVALFGTQAEDMGEALFNMDLSTAVAELGQVEGAAKSATDTLGDNTATSIEEAKRNIEVAVTGIQGALAAAFADPLSDAADFVSENRGKVLEFLVMLGNAGFDVGRALVEGLASGTEAVGYFISGPMADLADSLAGILDGLSWAGLGLPGAQDAAGDLRGFAESMREADDATGAVADSIRTNLIENGLDPMQERFNDFAEGEVLSAKLHDAAARWAGALDAVGYSADGTTRLVDALTIAQDGSLVASTELENQLIAAVAALDAEATAGAAAGETQESLTTRYNAGRDALIAQIEAMGIGSAEAKILADRYLAVPGGVNTTISSNAPEKIAQTDDLTLKITQLPDGSFSVVASGVDTALSKVATLNNSLNLIDGKSVRASVVYKQYGQAAMAEGGVLEFMAQGGVRGLTPMQSVAQMVPANTWRVVGDRGDVAEAYIPLDGSARSLSILAEVMQRMGVTPMASGGVVSSAPSGGTSIGDLSAALAAALMGVTIVVDNTVGIDRRDAARIVQVGTREAGKLG